MLMSAADPKANGSAVADAGFADDFAGERSAEEGCRYKIVAKSHFAPGMQNSHAGAGAGSAWRAVGLGGSDRDRIGAGFPTASGVDRPGELTKRRYDSSRAGQGD